MDESERYELGLRTRRDVLGDTHVDRALARRTPFTPELQDLLTRYAWGEVWRRLMSAVYRGLPAPNAAFRSAEDTLSRLAAEGQSSGSPT